MSRLALKSLSTLLFGLALVGSGRVAAQEVCGLATARFGTDIFANGFEALAVSSVAKESARPIAKGAGLGPPTSTVLPPTIGATPAISIASPAAGTTLAGERIQVSGTVSGPVGTGVTVNGVSAYVHNGAFATPEFSLPAGSVVLEAKATTIDGLTASDTRPVTLTAVTPDVTISSDLAAGYAPLNVNFLLGVRPPIAVQSLSVNFGDGVTFTGNSAAAVPRHAYANPGIYVVQFSVTDTNAVQYSASRRVVVKSLPQQREALCSLYAHLRARLAANDVPGALQAFHAKHRRRYDELFTAFGANRPTAAARLGTIANGTLGASEAELIVVSDDPDGLNGYPIHFSVDEDGVWRIDAM